MMTSFLNISPTLTLPTLIRSRNLSIPTYQISISQLKRKWGGGVLGNCSPDPDGNIPETETETLKTESCSSSSADGDLGISVYSWCAGLGALGVLETSYLTFLKLTNSDAFCPVGGGTCGDVLNSDYASVFGVPLPLIGMFAYGLVTFLGLQLSGKKFLFEIDENISRLTLLGTTTSMATASAYFLYILSTKFEGVTCSYCLVSALLSFTLLLTTIQDFGWQEIQKNMILHLCLGGLVVGLLSTSYGSSQSVAIGSGDVELRPFTTEITTESSSLTLALAKHLHSIGAKMYGAFWCSHCLEQKEMFGHEAAKLLDYVECFPSGYRKGIKIEKACAEAKIEGFPTWIINGEVLSGEQELSELARASGFKLDDFVPSN